MAYLARLETKAKLKRRAQEIDTRSKARLAAGRKKHAQFMADPQGYRTTPTQAATSTAELIIEDAERRARKILDEAQRHGVEIIRQARRSNPGRPTAAHPDPDEEPIRFREDDT
jgi:cell division septum initiation protein DivIVA